MTDIGHGSVICYAYLWASEHDGARKPAARCARPASMLITRGRDGRGIPLIFPIRSRSVEIPEIEARRAGLYTPAWGHYVGQ